jgi:6-phosphogluconolactonase
MASAARSGLRSAGVARLVVVGLSGVLLAACGSGDDRPAVVPKAGRGGSATGGTGGSTAAGGAPAGGGNAGIAGTANGGGDGDAVSAGGAGDAAPADLAADRAATDQDGSNSPNDTAGAPGSFKAFVYVGSNLVSEIRIFELDLQTGALQPRGSAPSGPSPDYLAFAPSGRFLYAINEVPAGKVVAFAVNQTSGALTMLNSAASGGSGPAHLSVHSSGKWVLTANYVSGHIAALPIMADGRVGDPVEPRLAGAEAHMIRDDGQSGRFVFVPSKGDNRVLQFKFDVETGRFTPNDPAFVAQAGSPRHMVFDRAGENAYLLTEAGLTVVAYKYDSTSGLLGMPVSLPAAPSGDGSHILLHPRKNILYTAVRFYDAIAIFDLDQMGRPQPPRHVRQMLARPWDFAIDPTGTFMLVANNDDATVQVFRLGDDGGLTRIGEAVVGQRPRFVGILAIPR